MNKAEWDVMVNEGRGLDRNRPADVTVAKIVMGWEAAAGNKYFKMLDGQLVLQQQFRPTTDRNACALVEEEIERQGLRHVYTTHLWYALCHDKQETPNDMGWAFRCVKPDLCCYCVLQSVEPNTKAKNEALSNGERAASG